MVQLRKNEEKLVQEAKSNNTKQSNILPDENINTEEIKYKKPSTVVCIILWYFTISFLLSGIGIISAGSLLSGIAWFIGGLVICPKINKEMKIKYKVISAIILFIIGCALTGDDSNSEISEEEQIVQENQDVSLGEKTSVTEAEEQQNELGESIKEQEEEQKNLTDKEQKEYINSVLAEYEETGKVPVINEAELYKEKLVFNCIYKKMQKAIEEEITEYTVRESLKYQEVYETWYPDGENMKVFKRLNNKYKKLKNNNEKIEEYDQEYINGIESAYDKLFESFYCDFYVQNKIEQGIISSVINKISGDDYIYYYANDVIYNEFFGDLEGDEEYLIRVDTPLEKRGSQSIFGYFTGSYEKIKESGGFERELPIFHAYTNANIKKIQNDYENYLKVEKAILKCEENIKDILKVNFFDENIERNISLDEEQEEYVCPDSATEKLTKSQVLNLSKKERWIAKNEIYARHGRKFNNQELQEYFNSTSWYMGIIEPEDFDESVFSKVEKANVRLLAKYE